MLKRNSITTNQVRTKVYWNSILVGIILFKVERILSPNSNFKKISPMLKHRNSSKKLGFYLMKNLALLPYPKLYNFTKTIKSIKLK